MNSFVAKVVLCLSLVIGATVAFAAQACCDGGECCKEQLECCD